MTNVSTKPFDDVTRDQYDYLTWLAIMCMDETLIIISDKSTASFMKNVAPYQWRQ